MIVPTLGLIATATVVYSAYQLATYLDGKYNQVETDQEEKKTKEKNQEKFKFPENPDDLLPDLPRDDKGKIQTADNLRIRPEKHEIQSDETYNPRHHGQHYHVETRRDTKQGWNKKSNVKKIEPKGYSIGDGTGFLPGENFPGMI
jgi:hypothetical protein